MHTCAMRARLPRRRTALLAGMLLAGTTAAAATLVEDFSGMTAGACFADGASAGVWHFVYNGYGCTGFVGVDGNTLLRERPKAAEGSGETHAGLVLGPTVSGDFSLAVSTLTAEQLRVNGAPNPWEVGWVLWHVADNRHFYYFIAKPNGWELGKADPAYPGGQRFLATGSSPTFPIRAWNRVAITQTGSTIEVSVNGRRLAQLTDGERPYAAGQIGLYTEDAEAWFDDVALTTGKARGGGKKGR